MQIRAFQPSDAAAAEALLQASWRHDPTMLELYRMHRDWQEPGLLRRTLVAEQAGVLLGAGTLFESRIHPLRLSLVINVAEGWRRRGVGSALWAALAQLGDGRPWQIKLTRRDPAGWAFAERRGFRPIITTLTALLDPQASDTRAWLDTLPSAPAGVVLEPIAAPSPAQTDALARCHAAVYRATHTWSPPAELDLERLRDLFCGPDSLPGSQLAAWREGRMIGAACLNHEPFQAGAPEGYLAHIGAADPHQPHAEALTAALLRRCLGWAAARGLRVRCEADSSHPLFRGLLEQAPLLEADRDFAIVVNDPARLSPR